ncbi:MAG TPA: NAD-binding protein [Pelomicrobium sp.]|nr:NAD-binding protein [Pelomicrobium sp.]
MSSVIFLALRRLRAPLITLIAVYAIAIAGLTLAPGVDEKGEPWRLGLFDAFYFMSYTATTIGFGELPRAFSPAQRLWATVCIYLAVIGWAYMIGSLLALLQDKAFRHAVTTSRFGRSVRRLREPFYLVCGYGETGSLLCRALDHNGLRFVVIDIAEERIDELELVDYVIDPPALRADARMPETLLLAGLKHRSCIGVIALTSDDTANLAVAMAVRLLNPDIPVLCRAMDASVAANMASFNTTHIINPFERFAQYLALAMHSPGSYRLLQWLTGTPGTTLGPETAPPRGDWVVCGYGRFGRAVVQQLRTEGLKVTIFDPKPVLPPGQDFVQRPGVQAEPLRQAGIEQAVGVVAGADDDVNNLSIVVTAKELNPSLFTVVRQNLRANQVLFEAFKADVTVVPSEVIAHEVWAILTTPLLARFLAIVKQQDDEWADQVVKRMRKAVGDEVPAIWSVRLDSQDAPALVDACTGEQSGLRLDHVLRDPTDRERRLPATALLVSRKGEDHALPEAAFLLERGDHILFAGTPLARSRQALQLANVNVRDYVWTGRDIPGGWVWQRLARGGEEAAK